MCIGKLFIWKCYSSYFYLFMFRVQSFYETADPTLNNWKIFWDFRISIPRCVPQPAACLLYKKWII